MVFQRLLRRCCLPAVLVLSLCFLSAVAATAGPVPAVAAPDGPDADPLTEAGRWEEVFTLPAGQHPWYWDPLTGWRADGAAILRTTDGGATWQMAATGLSAVEAFQFVDARNGWAWHAGSLGLVHTTDGGATWRPQSTGSDALNDLQFVDNLTGWVRGKVNELRRTTDGGVNWHPVAPLDEGVTGIQFVDRKHGWTFGTAAQLMDPVVVDWTWQARSTNGGMSWSGSGRPGVAVCTWMRITAGASVSRKPPGTDAGYPGYAIGITRWTAPPTVA